jgi:geranylgeranyl diphosphate synthase type I
MENRSVSEDDVLAQYRTPVDAAIRATFDARGDLPLYGMLQYFMGYIDETLRPATGVAGKRIRSSLLLLIADLFGGAPSALDLAVAVELFHNFTLIHDDIEDNDVERRGRPTVWKLWGVNHGINAGDAQAFITTQHLLKAAAVDPASARASLELTDHFLQVVEGQYLDFELADKPLTHPNVTVDAYLEMIRKKTSVLIGTAVAAGGVAAGCDAKVRDLLFAYGESFGMAYQIADDMSSIWGSVEETGKQAYGDIVERKKTYPILYVRDHTNEPRLVELYSSAAPLSDNDIQEVVAGFDRAGACEATKALGRTYVTQAHEAAQSLPLPQQSIALLTGLVDSLVRFPPYTHAAD